MRVPGLRGRPELPAVRLRLLRSDRVGTRAGARPDLTVVQESDENVHAHVYEHLWYWDKLPPR